nr:hypothetical protein [Thermoanaerobaculia bacterium]
MHSNGVHSGSPGGAPPVQPLHGPGPAGQSEHGHRARGRHHGHAACEEPEDCFTQAEAEAAAGIPGDDRFERLSPEQQELQARVAAGELTPEQAALLAGSNPPGHENACTAPGNSEYGHEQGAVAAESHAVEEVVL